MYLSPLYHWSPSERRLEIAREGLRTFAQPVVHSGGEGDERFAFPYICCGPTPALAWRYSGGSRDGLEDEFEGWDLWQVATPEKADVLVLPQWGAEVQEVRLRTAVPADHVWFVGTRQGLSAVSMLEFVRVRAGLDPKTGR